MTKIVRATLAHVEQVARLFDAYRSFYRQPSDLVLAKQFITERLTRRDSTILLALQADDSAAGFAQLYPSFTSIGAQRISILNDLYVAPACRRQGVGRQLMEAARQTAIEAGVARITLQTAEDNKDAQRLYESLGYTREAGFQTYSLPIPAATLAATAASSSAPSHRRQDQKLVIITGVTSGLGRAMVDKFAELNWMVAGCGRSAHEVEKLRQKFGSNHYFERVDITDSGAVERWHKNIEAHCGGIPDLLINNASIINRNAPTWEIPLTEFSQVMDINVMGTVNTLHVFMPSMVQRGAGTIVNVSSGWGRAGDAMVSAYCASKGAIEILTQAMAKEVPAGIAVVSLDPRDGVATPMLEKCAPDYMSSAPTAEEWAKTAVPFLIGISAKDNGKALTCPPIVRHQKIFV